MVQGRKGWGAQKKALREGRANFSTSYSFARRMANDPRQLLNLRAGRPLLPEGKCLYIQAGDPSDFDGYLIGYAGMELERHTSDFEFALVVRRQ